MILDFLRKMLVRFRSSKKKAKLKSAFYKLISKRKELDDLWDNEDYENYILVLDECIDGFRLLSIEAQVYRNLYKAILSQISVLNYKRDTAISEINRIKLQLKNQPDGAFMVLHGRPRNYGKFEN
jgi:hypothetical protein